LSTPSSPAQRRRISPATIAVGILVVIATILISAAGIYTDLLWFNQIGFQSVFLTQIFAQVALFLIGFALMFSITLVAFWLAYRHRPVYLRMPGESPFENYQQVIDNLRRLIMFGIPGILGVFAGVAATAQWTTALQFLNSTPSGQEDQQFGLDVSFYLFRASIFDSFGWFCFRSSSACCPHRWWCASDLWWNSSGWQNRQGCKTSKNSAFNNCRNLLHSAGGVSMVEPV